MGHKEKALDIFREMPEVQRAEMPWWPFWRLMGVSGSQDCWCFPSPLHAAGFPPPASSCSGRRQEGLRKAGLLPEPTATPRAPPAQSIPSFMSKPVSLESIPRFSPFCLSVWLHLLRRKRYFCCSNFINRNGVYSAESKLDQPQAHLYSNEHSHKVDYTLSSLSEQ